MPFGWGVAVDGSNTALGENALGANTTASSNTAVGAGALGVNTSGNNNTALGPNALGNNINGDFNTAVGTFALFNSTGNSNIALGESAGAFLTSGSNNIYIGNASANSESNTLRIANASHTRTFIDGIRGRTTGVANAITVLIDSDGQLGTVSSSRRTKEDIRDMGRASAALAQLRPVVFRYRQPFANGAQPLQYGLIAEEVAEVFPRLVAYDSEGLPETVLYRLLPPLLLNEFQRQQAELTKLNAKNSRLQQQMEQQAADLAQLKAQLELVKALLSLPTGRQAVAALSKGLR